MRYRTAPMPIEFDEWNQHEIARLHRNAKRIEHLPELLERAELRVAATERVSEPVDLAPTKSNAAPLGAK